MTGFKVTQMIRARHALKFTVLVAGVGLLICSALLISGCQTQTDTAEAATSEDLEIDMDSMDFEYTDRDQDPTYDEDEATYISLADGATTIDGNGASVEGDVVTITEEGTYVVTGELSDGQLLVTLDSETKAQVVLAGVTIHNEDGPAIYITQADKVFITLADGTENVLTDGSEYTLEDDSDEPYATLFSKDDLTINGSGTLTVTSSYRHAICSKDDLVITGGTFYVTSVEDAIRGRDAVKILDGTFVIESGEDAIKSNNDEDGTKGFVSIDGGTFTINAGDDALHAETVLLINDGDIDIQSCYEGLEGEQIYINGGDIEITASDDAINASLRDTVSGTTTDATTDGTASDMGGMGDMGDMGGEAPTNRGMSDSSASGGTAPGDGFDSDTTSGVSTQIAITNSEAPSDMGNMQNMGGGGTMGGTMSGSSESCLIQINGGYLVIEAGGDAIDSNGYLEINGGTIYANGPASGEDFVLDAEYSAELNGGTVIMLGGMTMPQTFDSGSQAYIYTNVSGSAGDLVALVDSSGNVLASFESLESFQVIIASSAEIAEGDSVTVVVGGTLSEDGSTVSGGTSTVATAQLAS